MLRMLATLFVWAATSVMTLAFAAETHVGRTLVSLTDHHGVHTGDIAIAVIATVEAVAFTAVIWATPLFRPRRPVAS